MCSFGTGTTQFIEIIVIIELGVCFCSIKQRLVISDVDETELLRRKNELLQRQLEMMQSQMAELMMKK